LVARVSESTWKGRRGGTEDFDCSHSVEEEGSGVGGGWRRAGVVLSRKTNDEEGEREPEKFQRVAERLAGEKSSILNRAHAYLF
jgi:hypothetical protein